jgi:hypothetical protein
MRCRSKSLSPGSARLRPTASRGCASLDYRFIEMLLRFDRRSGGTERRILAMLPERPETLPLRRTPLWIETLGQDACISKRWLKDHQAVLDRIVYNLLKVVSVKKFPLRELAHTSFRGVRVIHRRREREAHAEKHTKDRDQSAVARGPVAARTSGTPDRRSDDETVVACPEDWWLGRQAGACAKVIGPRPNRPNRSRSVTADDMASRSRRRPAPVSAGAVETIRPS